MFYCSNDFHLFIYCGQWTHGLTGRHYHYHFQSCQLHNSRMAENVFQLHQDKLVLYQQRHSVRENPIHISQNTEKKFIEKKNALEEHCRGTSVLQSNIAKCFTNLVGQIIVILIFMDFLKNYSIVTAVSIYAL